MKSHHVLDAGGVLLLGAVFSNWLPPIAAALGAIWYTLQIIESATFQRALRWLLRKGK